MGRAPVVLALLYRYAMQGERGQRIDCRLRSARSLIDRCMKEVWAKESSGSVEVGRSGENERVVARGWCSVVEGNGGVVVSCLENRSTSTCHRPMKVATDGTLLEQRRPPLAS